MRKITHHIIFSVLFLFLTSGLFSITYYSRTSGNWNTAATWSKTGCGGAASTTAPGAADDVIVCTGHTITMNGNPGACLSLTVNGTLKWTTTITTNVGTGGLTLNNGGLISGNIAGNLNVAGNFTVPAGASGSIGKVTITVTGATNVSGTLNCSSTGGNKTFSDFNIASGGAFNSAANETYAITGNLSMMAGTIGGSSTGVFNVSGAFNVGAGNSNINSGTLNVTGATTISGTLIFNNTTGNKNFGDLIIAAGGTWDNSIGETIAISGSLQVDGSFISGSKSYTFSGTGKTFTGTVSIDRIVCSGSYTNNANLTFNTGLSGAGTLTQGPTGILNIATNSASFSIGTFNASAIGNTVNYSFAGVQNVIAPADGSYCNLTLSGGNTKTLAAATIVTGNLYISSPATLNANNLNLTVGGNFTNDNIFLQGTATVTFNGTVKQTIEGATATAFNNLTISNTTDTLCATTNFSVGGTLTVGAGSVLMPSATVIVSGAGTLTGNGTVRVTRIASTPDFLSQYTIATVILSGLNVDYAGAGNQNVNALNYGSLTISANGTRTVTFPAAVAGISNIFSPDGVVTTYIITGNTIDFNGSVSQVIPAFNYYNLTSSSTGARTLASSGTIGIASVFSPGANIYTNTGSTIDYNGTISQNIVSFNYNNLTSSSTGARTLDAVGTIGIAGAFVPGTNAYTVTGNTVDYNGAATQTISAFSYNNLTSSSTGARTLASSGTIGIASVFTAGTNVYTITGSTIDFNGTASQIIPPFNYNNLTSSSTGTRTLSSAGTIGIAAAFVPGTNAYTITASTVNFNGAAAQTIPAFNYNNLTSSSTGARTLASAGTIGVAGIYSPGTNAYTITGSTIDFNGAVAQTIPAFNYYNLTSSSSGARTLASAGTVGVASIFTPGTNSYTITGSTINFNGTIAQIIPAFNYNKLVSSSSGSRTLDPSGTIGVASSFTPGTNVYTITGSTINYNGASAQTIVAFNYYNLTSSSTGARILISAGTIGVAAVFTPGTNIYTVTGNTVTFNGTSAQVIPAFTYYNLTSAGSSAKTLGGTLTINNNLIITSNLDVTGSNFSISIKRNWTNNGSFSAQGGTVTFNGTAIQTISGSSVTSFSNITVSNAAGISLGINSSISGLLNFTSGIITTGSNKITITSSGSVSGAGTSKFINGFLEKNIAAGASISRTFEIGNGSTDYLPVSLDFASVSVAGNITACVKNGDHPNVATSQINDLKSVNRYWQLSNSGATFTSYSATCNFIGIPADADAGSNSADYFMSVYNAAVWTLLTQGSATATTNQGTGITTIGDLEVGEKRFPVITTQPLNDTVCNATAASFSIAATGSSLNYQWQENSGSGFISIVDGGIYSGATSATLSLSAAAYSMNAYQYRCNVGSGSWGSTTTSDTVILTVNPDLPVSVSISADTTIICPGTNVTLTAAPTNGGLAPSYQWKLNGSNSGINSSTYSSASFLNNDVITCVLTSNAICPTGNPATSNSVTMTVNQVPVINCSDIAQFNDAGICGGFVSFNATAIGTPAPVISYSQPGDTIFYAGTTAVISYAANLCGTDSCSFNVIITDNEAPKLIGADSVEITTDPGVCYTSGSRMIPPEVTDNCNSIASYTNNAPATLSPGNNSVTWTITDNGGNVLTVNQYVRIVDPELPVITAPSAVTFTTTLAACSATGSIGTPTTSDNCGIASVVSNAPASFPVGTTTVTWTATDIHGNKSYAYQTITVITNGGALTAPTSIAGPTQICSNSLTNKVYTTPSVAGATGYVWYVTSSVASIVSGQGTNTITVNYSSALTTAHVFVAAQNYCGTSQTYGILVSKITPTITPGLISGPRLVCGLSSATYSVALVKGATSYSWTVPSGVTIVSGQGSNTVTVSYAGTFVSGSILVAGVNSCGTSTPRSLYVSVAPTVPGAISGPSVVCGISAATYSVALVSGATSYSWTVPSGVTIVSGQGTNVLNVNIAGTFSAGYLYVASVNACRTSAKRNLYLHKTPTTPGAIAGSALVCGVISTTYSVAPVTGSTSYTWVVPSGVTISSGQGTNIINVSIAYNFVSGYLYVKTANACGSSGNRSLFIHSAPATPAAIHGVTNACPYKGTTTNVKYYITAVAGASSYLWLVPAGATIVSGQGTTAIYVNYSGSFSSGNISVQSVGSCGNSPARTLAINTNITAPKTISGLANVCGTSLTTYSVAAVSGATSYAWVVPAGITIFSGQGTNSIQANIDVSFTSGTLSVTAVNNCGNSAPSTLALTGCAAKTNYTGNNNQENVNSQAISDGVNKTLSFLSGLYPNPTKELLNFELNVADESQVIIEIFNAEGKVVIREQVMLAPGRNTVGINFHEHAEGIYLARITDTATQKSETRRVVKE